MQRYDVDSRLYGGGTYAIIDRAAGHTRGIASTNDVAVAELIVALMNAHEYLLEQARRLCKTG